VKEEDKHENQRGFRTRDARQRIHPRSAGQGHQGPAEGVETRQQLQFLKQQSCHFYQGYLASKPLPAEVMAIYASDYLNKK